MCGVSVLSQKIKIKNRKHMRKIILISIAVLLLAGAGVATVAFSGLKATPEAQSVTITLAERVMICKTVDGEADTTIKDRSIHTIVPGYASFTLAADRALD